MAGSNRPSINELRHIYLLVGECLELGADPVFWRERLGIGLQGLIGDGVALIAELSPDRLGNDQLANHTVDVGWEDGASQASFEAYSREDIPEENPLLKHAMLPGRDLITLTASSTASEQRWRELNVFNYMDQARLDYDCLASVSQHPGNISNLLVYHPRRGARRFSPRHRRLLWLLHRELYGHLGGRLKHFGEPTTTDLSPRARDILLGLLEGNSVKQIAKRFGVSAHTATDYTKQIYRHLGVNSRGELIAKYGRLAELLSQQGWRGSHKAES